MAREEQVSIELASYLGSGRLDATATDATGDAREFRENCAETDPTY
jgi:hypothetical protein